MGTLKQILTQLFRWLLLPVRRANRRRYSADAGASIPHRYFPNAGLLAVVSSKIAGGEAVVINVRGYSMRPFLEHERDKVELSPWTDVRVGDAVLAEIAPGQYVLHRIIVREGDRLTLRGDGNIRGVEHCRVGDVRGVVTKYIRSDGSVFLASDTRLCRKIKLWGSLPSIVRRACLFIYKQTL